MEWTPLTGAKRRLPLSWMVSMDKYIGLLLVAPSLLMLALPLLLAMQDGGTSKVLESWPGFAALCTCAALFIWVGVSSEISNRHETEESVSAYKARMRAAEMSKGVYAYVFKNGDASLVLVDTRPTDVAPGGQLNGSLINSSAFYAGRPVAEWRGGRWVKLHDFQSEAKK